MGKWFIVGMDGIAVGGETILLHLHSTTHKKASCFARTKQFSRKNEQSPFILPFFHSRHLNGFLSTCLEITCLIKLWELFRLKIRSSHYWVCNQILDLLASRRFWGSHQASQPSVSHRSSEVLADQSTHLPPCTPKQIAPSHDAGALKCRDKSSAVAK